MMFGRRDRGPEAVDPELRELVVAAVLRNPTLDVSDPEVTTRMKAGQDVSFDELGLDSLARLTIAVDLDEQGFAVSEQEINEARTVDGLARLLAEAHR